MDQFQTGGWITFKPAGSTLALPLGVVWSFAANRKYFVRLMQRCGVTRKFGDEGVWEYTLNTGKVAAEYVNVRDFAHSQIYSGYVRAFSEGSDFRELLLENVDVYDLDSATKLYSMPVVYVSRKRDDLHVEFPYDERAEGASVTALPAVDKSDPKKLAPASSSQEQASEPSQPKGARNGRQAAATRAKDR